MRHHYVPEFLQKPWTGNSQDGKLTVFRLDIQGIPSKRHTPKHTGFDYNLYALTQEKIAGVEKQAVEKHFLRIIDNYAARVRIKLERDGLKSLTIEDRMDWARFLMSLRLRQPGIVEILKRESTQHIKATLNDQTEEYEELSAPEDAPTLEEWTEKEYPGLIENFGLLYFHELVNNLEIGTKILKMKWWLWDFSESSYDLLLSDHPCIFVRGIDDPNCIIALPIHPRKAFIATRSDEVAKIMRNQRPRDLVVRLNESSFNQTRVRIYACNESPRRFIENSLAKKRNGKEYSYS
jgi:hypothetical protein